MKKAWGQELCLYVTWSSSTAECTAHYLIWCDEDWLISWASLCLRVLWCSSEGVDLPHHLAAENPLGGAGSPGGISAWEPEGTKRGRVRVRTFGLTMGWKNTAGAWKLSSNYLCLSPVCDHSPMALSIIIYSLIRIAEPLWPFGCTKKQESSAFLKSELRPNLANW